MPSSADEDEQLTYLGEGIAYSLKGVASEMSLYGVYVTICLLAVYAVWTRKKLAPDSPRRSRFLFILFPSLFITFLLTTFNCVFSIVSVVSIISNTLVNNHDMTIPERVQRYGERMEPGWVVAGDLIGEFSVGGTGGGVVFVINNGLIIWRALSVWPRSRMSIRPFVGAFLGSLGISTFGLAIAALAIRVAKPKQVFPLHDVDKYQPLDVVNTISSLFTFLLNAVASGTFWYIVGKHRALATAKGSKFKKRRVLWFFFESGLMYVVLQTIRLLSRGTVNEKTTLFGSRMTFANMIMRITGIIWALYAPTLILILAFGHSLSDVVHARRAPTPEPTAPGEPLEIVYRGDLWTASRPVQHHRQRGQQAYTMTVGSSLLATPVPATTTTSISRASTSLSEGDVLVGTVGR